MPSPSDASSQAKALRQFHDHFKHSFEHGTALERYIGNKAACHQILDAAKGLQGSSSNRMPSD
jgi:hypothetical protein